MNSPITNVGELWCYNSRNDEKLTALVLRITDYDVLCLVNGESCPMWVNRDILEIYGTKLAGVK